VKAQKQAAEFKHKYNLKVINSAILCETLTAQGYTVIEFNSINNEPNVASLIEALGLQDQIAHSKYFTYQNDKYRLVFLHEDLNDEERTVVLAHEEGHIWINHLTENSILGNDVVQEHEANEFAHYLLKDKLGKIKRRKIISLVCVLVISIGIVAGIAIKLNYDKVVYTDDLYRTATGTKYHLRDCMYLENKTDVYRLTKEEFDSGEYEPCEACKPDER